MSTTVESSSSLDEPRVEKTVCALAPSHYQQDLLQTWFEKWETSVDRVIVEHDMCGVIHIWRVTGPESAFSELPYDVMAKKYKRVLSKFLQESDFY